MLRKKGSSFMRLFIAIPFDAPTREKLAALQERLRPSLQKGRLTRPENLHLTLAFLGEIRGDLSPIQNILEARFAQPLELRFSQTGSFRGDGGETFWAGLSENPALEELALAIRGDLVRAGFPIDAKQRYVAHVTLGREMAFREPPAPRFEVFDARAGRISLMKSERVQGVLTYTEIFGVSR